MPQRALVIDDEPDILELITISLERIGLDTLTASNLADARHLIASNDFDVCLTDLRLPDGNGIEFVEYLQTTRPNLPVAVITAHGDINSAVDAMKNGAFDFVSKPIDINLLRNLVTQAMSSGELSDPSSETDSAQRPAAEYSNEADASNLSLESLSGRPATSKPKDLVIGASALVGQSQSMQELHSLIAKVAKTNVPVWITGESGTGKERIAHHIHRSSARKNESFIAVNCAAIPPELMESELFGHRKGSFAGAHSDYEGLFKKAAGGSLFLDEVAKLSAGMQVKLLRAIQDRSISPIGRADEIVTDVRILSASQNNLDADVEAGRFRHDLYYRLNVISIKSPSLRERPEDIPLIAKHIILSFQENNPDGQLAILSPEAEEQLANYGFPGNVRELENIIERAITLSESNIIESSDLNLTHTPRAGTGNFDVQSNRLTGHHPDEVKAIRQALEKTRWNRKAAAVELGLTYRQLRYRLQQYGIDDKSR